METYNLATYNRTSNLYRWYVNYPDNSDEHEYLPYPEDIVRKWFAEEGRYFYLSEEDPCDYWANNLYTIGEIDDLYRYAKDHGCTWTRHIVINKRHYRLYELAEVFKREICIGDPYGKEDDNTPFWDWIDSLKSLGVVEEDYVDVDVFHNCCEDFKKMTPLPYVSFKAGVLKEAPDKDALINHMSEIVFDITELIQGSKYREQEDIDSRAVLEDIKDWAYEFEYKWTHGLEDSCEEHYSCYGIEIQNFVDMKLKEKEN